MILHSPDRAGYSITMMSRKYLLHTLGCKVNQYESQEIRQLLAEAGFAPAATGEQADLAVVNTCAVTTTALAKSRQAVRRFARKASVPVVVVGCGAAADRERMNAIPGVQSVLSHDQDVLSELRRIVSSHDVLKPLRTSSSHTGDAWPPYEMGAAEPLVSEQAAISQTDGREKEWMMTDCAPGGVRSSVRNSAASPRKIIDRALPVVKHEDVLLGRIDEFAGHQRAFVKIQDGCDAYCTYCIIPQLRHRLKNKPIEVAVEEARRLVRAGYREIILTGIFLGAYDRPTALRKRFDTGQSPLANLVKALTEIEGLERLRLSSLEPGDVDDALLEVLATHANCVPHLHLPLQSGSAEVLRRMNRQYDRDDFFEMIDRVQVALDRPAISTDVIVGFPGETDADFADSVEVARYAEFCKIHAFPFSPRPGTAAARWQSQFVPPQIAQNRMAELARVENETSLAYRSRFIGHTERVIVEKCDPLPDGHRQTRSDDGDSRQIAHGRCDRYFRVHCTVDEPVAPGSLLQVRIDKVTPGRTQASAVVARPADASGAARDRALPVLSS